VRKNFAVESMHTEKDINKIETTNNILRVDKIQLK